MEFKTFIIENRVYKITQEFVKYFYELFNRYVFPKRIKHLLIYVQFVIFNMPSYLEWWLLLSKLF